MIYLDLNLSSPCQCRAGSRPKPCPRWRSGCFIWTWTGVPNANVGQVAVLSHAQACSVNVLPWTWTGVPQYQCREGCISHSQACALAVDVLPGLGPEFPNANVGQVPYVIHVQACSEDVLPGLGPELPNATVGKYAGLSHSRTCAVDECFT